MKALITGHGRFADGMLSALELIAGPQDDIKAIIFTEDAILSEYQDSLKAFVDENEEGFIFTDLVGGTPFNTAMMAKGMKDGIHIFGGTNLTMLLEFYAGGIAETPADELEEAILHSGKDGVQVGAFAKREDPLEDEESEGI